MDIRNTIKNNLASQMAKVGHINMSKDHTELKGMVSEKTVKFGKKDVYEILDEVTKTEGDLEEIRLNPFGSNIKDIEKVSKDFIKVLNKKMPKLRIKHVERLNKLLSNVESEIRNARNKYNTDKVTDNRDEVISKIKSELEEMTGAASAGGFLGPLFSAPIKRTGPAKKASNKKPYNVTEGDDTCGVCGSPVEECKCEGHKHDVDEQKGHSPYLVSDENPTGETDGLTSDILTKILTKIAKTHDEEEGDLNEVNMMRIGDEGYDNINVSRRAKDDHINKELVDDIAKAANMANVKAELTYGKTGHRRFTRPGVESRHWHELAIDISRLQDLNNPEEKKPLSHRRNPSGFKTAGDRLCSALETLGYHRNAEGKHPKAVIWHLRDGSHKDHLHVSNTGGVNTSNNTPEKREKNIVRQNLTIKDIISNGDNSELLAKGSSGKGVEELQQMLLDKGYELPAKGVDGLYGPETASAVKKFQEDNNLKVDGVVGIETSTALTTVNEEDGEIQKVEAKEATLSSSSGSYETPFFLAKNKKNWRGAAKTLYKGGQFVKVKDKCKTFPYCNQGDIKALELFEGYDELAEKVAKKMGEDSLKVKSLVLNDLEESLFQERMKELNKSRIDKSEKNNRLVKK